MLLYFFLLVAQADETKIIKYQSQTEIDFEAIDILGEMVKLQGSIIMERSNAKFNPLIELRTDWNPEMIQSVGHIK
jgi:glutaredoxin-related protein